MLILKGESGKLIIINILAEHYETLIINSTNSSIASIRSRGYSIDTNIEDISISDVIEFLKENKTELVIFYANCKEDEVDMYKEFGDQLVPYLDSKIGYIITVQ